MEPGEEVWNIIIKWDKFAKPNSSINTIGIKLNNYIKSIGRKTEHN